MNDRRAIIIAGVPGVGKTTISRALAERFGWKNISVSELVVREGSLLGKDEHRDTDIVDLSRLNEIIAEAISASDGPLIIEGHYAYEVVPSSLVYCAIVLRRAPWVMKEELQGRGYSDEKTHENVEAELLDVPLVEAIDALGPDLICEVDTTGRTPEETLDEVIGIIKGTRLCRYNLVDWLGSPEARLLLEVK
ncbi:MAG: adenylate kinase family protein [Candidatus Bathyarchaeota archaeon]|jgi:adenylate kinase|nr:adenylate kinase family protein [Candidatus Bathyarchaeota archaeon]